jgi:membrane-associated phospholipid phosphatase
VYFAAFAALAAATVLAGCSGSGNPQPFQGEPGVDPDGGTWRTVVIQSGSAIELPAPPDSSTIALQKELQELRDLQADRTPAIADTVRASQGWTVLRWNEMARGLVASTNTPPTEAARIYAMLSVAQYDALICAWHNKYLHDRPSPTEIASHLTTIVDPLDVPCYPSEDAVVAVASYEVLKHVFPGHIESLREQMQTHLELPLWNASAFRSDIIGGTTLGAEVARRVIAYTETDGSDAQWDGTVPTGEGVWYSSQTPPKPPVTPHWADVRPWLMSSPDQFRAPAPPQFGSPEFHAAVAQLVQITQNRTLEQARIASTWSDGPYTYTPPGHWNDIAGELIFLHGLNPLRAARVLATLNMAEMDASIAAWDAKYAYWLIRPSQVDPRIDHGDWQLPNFPAYTSGHSCFSGAASAVLAWFFPAHAATLRGLGEEAGVSRVYGGIHYMFDNTGGLAQGRAIAGLAIERAQQDGASIRQVTSTQQVNWEPEEAGR